MQAKHGTQEELDYVISVEHCIIWLRDPDTMRIGEDIFVRITLCLIPFFPPSSHSNTYLQSFEIWCWMRTFEIK